MSRCKLKHQACSIPGPVLECPGPVLECLGPSLDSHHLVAVPARGPHDLRPGQRAPNRSVSGMPSRASRAYRHPHQPSTVRQSTGQRPAQAPSTVRQSPPGSDHPDPDSGQRHRSKPAALANKSVPHGYNRAAVSLAPSESVPRGTRAVSAPRAVRWGPAASGPPDFQAEPSDQRPSQRAPGSPAQRVSVCPGRPPDPQRCRPSPRAQPSALHRATASARVPIPTQARAFATGGCGTGQHKSQMQHPQKCSSAYCHANKWYPSGLSNHSAVSDTSEKRPCQCHHPVWHKCSHMHESVSSFLSSIETDLDQVVNAYFQVLPVCTSGESFHRSELQGQ
jgi:hypothetical protein